MEYRFGYFILILFSCIVLHAQDYSAFERWLEIYPEATLEDAENLYDQWTTLIENPINLNAKRLKVQDLFFLPSDIAEEILYYKYRFGEISDYVEILILPGMNDLYFEMIKQVTTLKTKEVNANSKSFKLSASTRLSIYENTFSEKDFIKYTNRKSGLKINKENLTFALVTEADREEHFIDTLRNSPEHLSGGIHWKGKKFLKEFILGTYYCVFGQGLTLGQGTFLGKGAEVINTRKMQKTVRLAATSSEANYFQGMASRFEWGDIGITAFLSALPVDARIDTLEHGLRLVGLDLSGLHTTILTINRKDNILQYCGGASVNLKKQNFEIGIHGFSEKYTKVINPPTSNFSITGAYSLPRFCLWGEAAGDNNLHSALQIGITSNPVSNISITSLYRNYPKGYNGQHAASFAGGEISEEEGLYIGTRWETRNRWNINCYLDLMRFGHPKYFVPTPSEELDFLITSKYNFSNKNSFEFRYRHREKLQGNSELLFPMVQVYKILTENIRLEFKTSAESHWRFNSRAEITIFTREQFQAEAGVLFFQQGEWRNQKFTCILRTAFFSSPSWNSRTYAYENDVTGSFSIPSFSGNGIRFTALAKWKFTPSFCMELKSGNTIFSENGIPHYKPDGRILISYYFRSKSRYEQSPAEEEEKEEL